MNCFVDELENILFRAFCFEGRRKKLLDDQALTRDGLLSISDAVHAQSLAAFATDFSTLKCAQLACRVLHAHFVSTQRLMHVFPCRGWNYDIAFVCLYGYDQFCCCWNAFVSTD